MSPPTVLDPIALQWRCQRRAHCCRTWRIDVQPAELREMAQRCAAVDQLGALVRLLTEHPEDRRLDGSCALPMKRDGSCLFLQHNRCRYRAEHGDESLPVSCRKFPHLGLLTPRRRLVGLSFTCPTALELLAGQCALELVEDYRGPLPFETFCDFRGEESDAPCPPDGHPGQASAQVFWDEHWKWFTALRRATGSPSERLRALAERVSGLTLPTVAVDPALWTATQFDAERGAPLVAAGASPSVLAAVYDDWPSRIEPSALPADPAEDDLLNRYLDHRLLVPEFLITGASLGRLLGVLFAVVARYRIERAWGRRALWAVLHLDRLVLHSDFVPRLFPDDVAESDAWQSLALMALATS